MRTRRLTEHGSILQGTSHSSGISTTACSCTQPKAPSSAPGPAQEPLGYLTLDLDLPAHPSAAHTFHPALNPAGLGCLSASQHCGKGLVMGNFTFSSQIVFQMQATAGHPGLMGNFCVPCSQTTKLRHQERKKTVADGEGCKATAPKPEFRPFCQLQNNLHPYQSS